MMCIIVCRQPFGPESCHSAALAFLLSIPALCLRRCGASSFSMPLPHKTLLAVTWMPVAIHGLQHASYRHLTVKWLGATLAVFGSSLLVASIFASSTVSFWLVTLGKSSVVLQVMIGKVSDQLRYGIGDTLC